MFVCGLRQVESEGTWKRRRRIFEQTNVGFSIQISRWRPLSRALPHTIHARDPTPAHARAWHPGSIPREAPAPLAPYVLHRCRAARWAPVRPKVRMSVGRTARHPPSPNSA
jgi:hypothetical protein